VERKGRFARFAFNVVTVRLKPDTTTFNVVTVRLKPDTT
jgi:hypothetical protein